MSNYSWKAIAWRDLWLIPILFVTTLFFWVHSFIGGDIAFWNK